MTKKKSPAKDSVEDSIEKFVRKTLDAHGEMISQELKEAVVKAGFKVNTYTKARSRFEWIDSRKEAGNKTYWFVKEKQASVPPLAEPRWSFPSINLGTLDRKDTVRMLRTTDDPLLRHLLKLLEDADDTYQDGREKGHEDGCRNGRKEAFDEAVDVINEIEGELGANPLLKRALDKVRQRINQRRSD